MGAWWQAYQLADASQKVQLMAKLSGGREKGRRRKRGEQVDLGEMTVATVKPASQSPSATKPKATPNVPVPTFEKVAYCEADFLKLLNSDEPFIPSQRYRRREPSSGLSIREREQGLTEDTKKPKKSKHQKTKTDKTQTNKVSKKKTKPQKNDKGEPKTKKPAKKKKKSNAKPKADN